MNPSLIANKLTNEVAGLPDSSCQTCPSAGVTNRPHFVTPSPHGNRTRYDSLPSSAPNNIVINFANPSMGNSSPYFSSQTPFRHHNNIHQNELGPNNHGPISDHISQHGHHLHDAQLINMIVSEVTDKLVKNRSISN